MLSLILILFGIVALGWIVRRSVKLIKRDNIPEDMKKLSGISNAIFGLLVMQLTMAGEKPGESPVGRAGDDWSNGYIQGYSRYLISRVGDFDSTATAATVSHIFECLFGRAEGHRINALRDLTETREATARSGFDAGERDAKRYVESGGQAGTTGWLQHLRSDLFK